MSTKAAAATALDIKLLGREYRVACAPDERESLQRAVAYLEEKMGELAAKTKSTGERLAVMTALNLAHELLSRDAPTGAAGTAPAATDQAAAEAFDRQEYGRRIEAIAARLDAAMAEQEKLF